MRQKTLFILLVACALVLAGCGGRVAPTPGGIFSGPIETGDRAGSGTLSSQVSEDAGSITDLSIALTDVACDGLTLGRIHDLLGGSLTSVVDGRFSASMPAMGGAGQSESQNYSLTTSPAAFPVVASLETVGRIDGEFTSSTQAAGTLTIHIWVVMSDRACELGTFPWSATEP